MSVPRQQPHVLANNKAQYKQTRIAAVVSYPVQSKQLEQRELEKQYAWMLESHNANWWR